MSALAEALMAAQRRAISAMEKAYVAGRLDRDTAIAALDGIGATDAVDRDRLLLALDTIREWGASLPAEPKQPAAEQPEAKASDAQVARIQRDLRSRDLAPLVEQDLRNLSKGRASELIDSLAAGTYDAAAWDVPF
jgi:hypothetical protein